MNVTPIKTSRFLPPKEDFNKLFSFIPKLHEETIVVISSKVTSICEGQTVAIGSMPYDDLVKKTAGTTL